MNEPPDDEISAVVHDLNNLLGKIIGAAELALDHAQDPQLRAELETIISLSEEGASIVGRLRPGTKPS